MDDDDTASFPDRDNAQVDPVALAREFLREHPPELADERELREARFDAGLAFVSYRPGLGGLGVHQAWQVAVDDVFRSAGLSDWRDANVIGLGMAAPTIYRHGSPEQHKLLRPLFSGEHIWCQLFSEPGSGSDLASLASSARRDGDDWIVNGQKVWTSLGHVARYGLLLARTDPGVVKHRGLTFFLLDMTLPGVTVRPLRQLTGDAEFNEVFLTDVRVPDSARIGPVGGGWSVALTTLANERTSLGASIGARSSGPIGQAIELWRVRTQVGFAEPELLDRLIRLWCRSEVLRLMSVDSRNRGGTGPEGSLAKLQMAEINQAIYDLCIDLMGVEGILYDTFAETQPAHAGVHGGGDVRRAFLRTLANSIEGGTSEIQRTIIGERILGLAQEPRVDKDRPWNEVPRS